MPVEHSVEDHADGSRTVWLSEHEPMNRMKGMLGICLRPDSVLIEAKIQIYNRTPLTQTFLWWANVGVHANNDYEAIFPPDVTFVADHAKRAYTDFPIAKAPYYGVDYSPGTDLRWYRNIPVPTSYMVTRSDYDFMGGYDHGKQAGFIHVADRRVAPGKKLWTWGNADFGRAWDRELTDTDGPYIELMSGVFTDNQPDFSWLHPYETRTASQFWYPIQQIGPVKNANTRAALSLDVVDGGVRIGIAVTEAGNDGLQIVLSRRGTPIHSSGADLRPGNPFQATIELDRATAEHELELVVYDRSGCELVGYRGVRSEAKPLPHATVEPPLPGAIGTIEQLYLTGLHLEQYRHATRDPEPYWEEVLRRDPGDSRAHMALGAAKLRVGEFAFAEAHFRAAIERTTMLNPNPREGEAHYLLGLSLDYQRCDGEAEAAFGKARWNYAWQSAASYTLARIASRRGAYAEALARLDECLASDTRNNNARTLSAALRRRLGLGGEALHAAHAVLAHDALDQWALAEAKPDSAPIDPQLVLDLTYDYTGAGLYEEASRVLTVHAARDDCHPMILYTRAWVAHLQRDDAEAALWLARAALASPDYCFPVRLEERQVLEYAVAAAPRDGRAPYYLGNLLYDRRCYDAAISAWETAVALDAANAIAWRNLGIAYFNKRQDPERANYCYLRALSASPADARQLYEFDQLRKKAATALDLRLATLSARLDLVDARDDLSIEYATLLNNMGRYEGALAAIEDRRFHPWEGGEGLAARQYARAHFGQAVANLAEGSHATALGEIDAARSYPASLGEGKPRFVSEAHLDYVAGLCLDAAGDSIGAASMFNAAAASHSGQGTETAYWRALALLQLGRITEAAAVRDALKRHVQAAMNIEPTTDYFATSLPDLLLFEGDPRRVHMVEQDYLQVLIDLLRGRAKQARLRLRKLLSAEPAHERAIDLLQRIESGRKLEWWANLPTSVHIQSVEGGTIRGEATGN